MVGARRSRLAWLASRLGVLDVARLWLGVARLTARRVLHGVHVDEQLERPVHAHVSSKISIISGRTR